MTGKIRADRKQSGRMMGVGLGKGLKLGFELGTPVEKQRCMSLFTDFWPREVNINY